jgi:two-component system response regulator (stage 0 sporulation protein F)
MDQAYEKKKILIVDDEPLILFGLSRTFQDLADVTSVGTGEQACEELSHTSYDLCFLDIYLPNMNGLEVMDKIKEKTPGTKVVVMTAYADDDIKQRIKDKACLLIEKPFNLAEVKHLIKKELA